MPIAAAIAAGLAALAGIAAFLLAPGTDAGAGGVERAVGGAHQDRPPEG